MGFIEFVCPVAGTGEIVSLSIASLASVVLFTSYLSLVVWKLSRRKSTEIVFHPYPLLAFFWSSGFRLTFLQSLFEEKIGDQQAHCHMFSLVISIGTGIAIPTVCFFVILDVLNSGKKAPIPNFVLGVGIKLVVDFGILVLLFRTFVFGGMFFYARWSAAVFDILMYLSPLPIIMDKRKATASDYLPSWLCSALLFNSFAWAVAAFNVPNFDSSFKVTNVIGTFLALIQLVYVHRFSKLSMIMNMTTPTIQYPPSSRMGLYEPLLPLNMWDGDFQGGTVTGPGVCQILEVEAKLDDKTGYSSDKSLGYEDANQSSKRYSEKAKRRLAQNREAAKKSRLRKKAYVQELETSRMKLAKMEHELEITRQQGSFIAAATSNMGLCRTTNSGIAAFLVEYGHWIDEQDKKMSELRNFVQSSIGERELQIVVQNVLKHYCNLFRMKRDAARVDAFYLVSGTWKTSVERLFLWIGGFQPSALINVVTPQLVHLSEEQMARVENLKHSCMQAEDALSQGMEKLQQTLGHSLTVLATGAGNYSVQMALSIEKLESLGGFILQADHIREQMLQNMSQILNTRQAAMGLLAFGEYFQRLRALSSLWNGRPQAQQGLM